MISCVLFSHIINERHHTFSFFFKVQIKNNKSRDAIKVLARVFFSVLHCTQRLRPGIIVPKQYCESKHWNILSGGRWLGTAIVSGWALFGMPKTKGSGSKAKEKSKKASNKPYEVPAPRPSVSQKEAEQQEEFFTCDSCKRSSAYMFCSVNVVVYGSVMFAMIFLAIFLMVSLVSRASIGFVVVVMALLWALSVNLQMVIPLVRSLIQQFISLLTKPWVSLLKFWQEKQSNFKILSKHQYLLWKSWRHPMFQPGQLHTRDIEV